MTCMKCRHWEQCVLPDGTTHYYGKECACANVDHLCKWFVPKNEQPKWIPVTERLPRFANVVIVYRKHGLIGLDFFIPMFGEWAKVRNGRRFPVTHWMPLPQPPKEVQG